MGQLIPDQELKSQIKISEQNVDRGDVFQQAVDNSYDMIADIASTFELNGVLDPTPIVEKVIADMGEGDLNSSKALQEVQTNFSDWRRDYSEHKVTVTDSAVINKIIVGAAAADLARVQIRGHFARVNAEQ